MLCLYVLLFTMVVAEILISMEVLTRLFLQTNFVCSFEKKTWLDAMYVGFYWGQGFVIIYCANLLVIISFFYGRKIFFLDVQSMYVPNLKFSMSKKNSQKFKLKNFLQAQHQDISNQLFGKNIIHKIVIFLARI